MPASRNGISGCSKKKGCIDSTSSNYDKDAEEDDGSCTYNAGLGGNVTIAAFPKHHGMPIVSDSLYPDSAFVKFNTSNYQGPNASSYDLSIAGEAGEDHVHIVGLKRGKYFIFMKGHDNHLQDTIVSGGIPNEIIQTSGEIDLDVPVSE